MDFEKTANHFIEMLSDDIELDLFETDELILFRELCILSERMYKIGLNEGKVSKVQNSVIPESKWISVSEKLPITNGFVNVKKKTKPYIIGLYFDSNQDFRYAEQIHTEKVTHWQPMPSF